MQTLDLRESIAAALSAGTAPPGPHPAPPPVVFTGVRSSLFAGSCMSASGVESEVNLGAARTGAPSLNSNLSHDYMGVLKGLR